MLLWYGTAININTDNDFSLWNRGPQHVFHKKATPSNYLQMLTSHNAASPHLFVGGRSHYNKHVLSASIEHRLAHFMAACWTFTTNIPDCGRSLYVRLNDFQQSVKKNLLVIQAAVSVSTFANWDMICSSSRRIPQVTNWNCKWTRHEASWGREGMF